MESVGDILHDELTRVTEHIHPPPPLLLKPDHLFSETTFRPLGYVHTIHWVCKNLITKSQLVNRLKLFIGRATLGVINSQQDNDYTSFVSFDN